MKHINKYEDRTEQFEYMQSLIGQDKYDALNEMISESKHIVFFGGAGVSTESGIPDFRSKDGLYNQHDVQFDKYKPEYLLSRSCLYNNPKVFYEFYRQKMDVRTISPNKAHFKLAEMEKAGKLDGVITQNIDGLHQKAGSQKVWEIHGTTLKNYCVKCGAVYPSDYIFNNTDAVPKCTNTVKGERTCNCQIRPAVTLYEENLPKEAWDMANNLVFDADMLIVGGTSLTVYPAAYLVPHFKGKYLVIISKDGTDYDKYADLSFHESIGHVFEQIKLD